MITAAFQNDSNKVYFFGNRVEGGEYVRYDGPSHSADPDYPRSPLSSWWEGLPFDGVDAAIFRPWDSDTNWHFFISGSEYIRWPIPAPRYGIQYPRRTAYFGLHGLGFPWSQGVDAAFVNKWDILYVFCGLNYVRRTTRDHFFEDADNDIDSGYPKTISEGWGLDWHRVTAAFQNLESGTIYLFNENDYVRYSAGRTPNQGPDDGYPKTIEEGWGPVVASL